MKWTWHVLATPALLGLLVLSAALGVVRPTTAAADPVLVGAGDIADCGSSTDAAHAEATAKLLDDIDGTVFTAGDNAYSSGTAAQFRDCYHPRWGRQLARTRPAPGNHDYETSGASGYFGYFGDRAGPAGRGYYSYDLGGWHILSLNSEIAAGAASAQAEWLRADLDTHPASCTLAYWHKPLFSSGEHGNVSTMRDISTILYQHGADVIVAGHDHDYERFAPQDPAGNADPKGIREFVVGTGGAHQRSFGTIRPNSERHSTGVWGVLKLTLHASSYDWQFLSVAGQTFSDAGSAACVGASVPTTTATNAPPSTPPVTPPSTPQSTPMATATPTSAPPPSGPIAATVETDPVPHSGDAADDAAIWVNDANVAQSTIIGTDKQGGLAVYGLDGKQIQYLPDGDMNNVDIRSGFPLGNEHVALVTAGNRSNDTLAIYRVNPASGQLEHVAARAITTLTVYGSCMYHSPTSDKYYYFVNSEAGEVEQWELFDNGSGKVDATRVRTFDVGSQTEGCVADDQLGHFYIGEEARGIWKYGAEPDAGSNRTQVDTTGSGGHLAADVEGLTIAYGGNGTGYLIASSQGNNAYVIYERGGNNAYLKTFTIAAGNGIDGTSDTDGIDVTTANLGPAFPNGVFVAQDGANDNGNQNFKLVPWQAIIGGSTSPPPPTSTPTPGTPTPTPPSATPQPTASPPPSGSCEGATIQALQASGDDGNVPGNVLDSDLATRWSHNGIGSWIEAELSQAQPICSLQIAWYRGDLRVNTFAIQASADGTTFQQIFSGSSSGRTLDVERYAFAATTARFVRITVNGNTENTWASITELRVNDGTSTPPPPSVTPAPTTPLPTLPAPPVPPQSTAGIWLSAAEVARLPMSGSAWSRLKAAADGDLGEANIADQNSGHDVRTLAVALVYARTGNISYRTKAANAILSAIGTEQGGRTLALGRNLPSYVIAADLIDLRNYDSTGDQHFRAWLSAVRREELSGKTLISTHEDRPNNWGTHAGAARVAADRYLGDTADLARAAQVFKGWLGDRSAYAGFTYGDTSWQADPSKPVGINAKGTTRNGHSIDGVLPDDQRRAGGFTWPPPKENYVWEGLQGAIVQAELLARAGYDVWNWQDQALLRAYTWLHTVCGFSATGDDTWQTWIVNARYGTSFPAGAGIGKNMAWTDWAYTR